MNPDDAYEQFSSYLLLRENLSVKSGKGGLSFYKDDVFVCHFNARPQAKREDLGFADFRYGGLKPYLNIETTIQEIQKDAYPEVQIKSHKLWCSLHFPLHRIDHVAGLFLRHIISKVRNADDRRVR